MRQRESLTSQVSWIEWFTQIYVPFVDQTDARKKKGQADHDGPDGSDEATKKRGGRM
jgi:hypothetical protein